MLDLDKSERIHLWNKLTAAFDKFYDETENLSVTPRLNKEEIRNFIEKSDTNSYEKALDHVVAGLTKYAVHTPHPMYFGLFNPRSSFAGIVADTLTAIFNPQMAAWSHAPFAVEAESYLIRELGKKFGYPSQSIDGAFCSGGAEANLTALICAAQYYFPDLKSKGWKNLQQNPVIYCSAEAHHSVLKAAIIIGIGSDAVRSVKTLSDLKMDVNDLKFNIEQDLKNGMTPIMVIATEGATGTGVIDDLTQIIVLREKYRFWLHADAAYGGGVMISPACSHLLTDIEKADSVTFDAHKWLSVPMGAGIFLTRHPDIMQNSFSLVTEYMPKDADGMEVTDPFTHTIQWSRRFIGLKLYMSVIMYGWDGLAKVIENQIKTGNYLKQEILKSGWRVYNDSALPVVCFGKDSFEKDKEGITAFCQRIIASGQTWISVYKINDTYTLRACITNYNTSDDHIDKFIQILNTTD